MIGWNIVKILIRTFLLELIDGTLVDTTALVDQVTSGGRLAGVDVADNDHVDVSLILLTYLALSVGCRAIKSKACRDVFDTFMAATCSRTMPKGG